MYYSVYLEMISTSDPMLCFYDCIELERDFVYKLPTLIGDKDLNTPIAAHHILSLRWWMSNCCYELTQWQRYHKKFQRH